MKDFKWKYFNSDGEWVRKPSITWIKQHTKETNPKFFSRENLSFFNQTMKDFKVVLSNGRLFIYAPDCNAIGSGRTFYTLREVFADGTMRTPDSNPATTESGVLQIIDEETEQLIDDE